MRLSSASLGTSNTYYKFYSRTHIDIYLIVVFHAALFQELVSAIELLLSILIVFLKIHCSLAIPVERYAEDIQADRQRETDRDTHTHRHTQTQPEAQAGNTQTHTDTPRQRHTEQHIHTDTRKNTCRHVFAPFQTRFWLWKILKKHQIHASRLCSRCSGAFSENPQVQHTYYVESVDLQIFNKIPVRCNMWYYCNTSYYNIHLATLVMQYAIDHITYYNVQILQYTSCNILLDVYCNVIYCNMWLILSLITIYVLQH